MPANPRSSRAYGRCATTTGASPGCSTHGSRTGWRRSAEHGLTLDILVQNWRRDAAGDALSRQRCPELRIVLDHCGKPTSRARRFRAVGPPTSTRLAALPNVACKLSGLLNCAAPGAGPPTLEPYADHVLDRFWPRSRAVGERLAAARSRLGLRDMEARLRRDLAARPHPVKLAVERGTAERVYRLRPAPNKRVDI